MKRIHAVLGVVLIASALCAKGDAVRIAIANLSSDKAEVRAKAEKDLVALGKPAYAPLAKALATRKDAALQRRGQRILDQIAWGKGLAKIKSALKKANASGDRANRASPSELAPVVFSHLKKLYPRHAFWRIVHRSRYYKPGQDWHGTLYVVERFASEPQEILTIGRAVLPAWNRMLALEKTHLETPEAVRKFVRTVIETFGQTQSVYYDKKLQVERGKAGWKIWSKHAPKMSLFIQVDAKHVATKVR
jgi:hypothetical protein